MERNASERLSAGGFGSEPGPILGGCEVSSSFFEACLFGQEAHVQSGQKAAQLFEIGAVFQRLFFDPGVESGFECGCVVGIRAGPQTFGCAEKFGEERGEVLKPDGGAVCFFGPQAGERRAQVLVHLTQGF